MSFRTHGAVLLIFIYTICTLVTRTVGCLVCWYKTGSIIKVLSHDLDFSCSFYGFIEIKYCGYIMWKVNVDQKQEQIDCIICKSAFNNLYFWKFSTKLLE